MTTPTQRQPRKFPGRITHLMALVAVAALVSALVAWDLSEQHRYVTTRAVVHLHPFTRTYVPDPGSRRPHGRLAEWNPHEVFALAAYHSRRGADLPLAGEHPDPVHWMEENVRFRPLGGDLYEIAVGGNRQREQRELVEAVLIHCLLASHRDGGGYLYPAMMPSQVEYAQECTVERPGGRTTPLQWLGLWLKRRISGARPPALPPILVLSLLGCLQT